MIHSVLVFLGSFFLLIGIAKATYAFLLYWRERRGK